MDKKKEDYLRLLLASLPELPGVYQFFDVSGTLIYIGKAKNLKKRVSSYFTKTHDSGKTRVLVSKIVDIKHMVVDTESDALLLENNLIKKHQPRYNVMLKDDKTYPWICIKKERFPRVFPTRSLIKDGSEYFGPYASGKIMKTLLDLIKQLYKLRNCNYILSDENIEKKKIKVCLEYHVGNCAAPCVGLQNDENYNVGINGIRSILKGDLNKLLSHLKELMKNYASEFRFEDAQIVKEKIDVIENFKSKSTIVNPQISNVDVFSIVEDETCSFINFLRIIDGAIIQTHTIELRKKIDESANDMLAMAIVELRDRFESNAQEIIVPFEPEFSIAKVQFTVPQRGDKKTLLDLSWRNARYYMQEKHLRAEKANPASKTQRILEQMQKDLRMKELPKHIECFDNSNLQGTNPVAACVVFYNAKPAKKEYRHFNVKTVEGPNDFATMEEIITRRYTRLLNENKNLPQLVIVDGGKGQLSSAAKCFEKLNLTGKVHLIGIAKRLEEIYFPGDPIPLYIDKNSESLKIIQQLRNEAHRFGITFHRDKRSKSLNVSELDSISGIGENTKQKLFSHFKSIRNIKKAEITDLASIIGESKALLVFNHFRNSESTTT